MGELNLLHVLALVGNQTNAVDAITNMQRRSSSYRSDDALLRGQIAAKNNRMYVDSEMTDLLREHVGTIRIPVCLRLRR